MQQVCTDLGQTLVLTSLYVPYSDVISACVDELLYEFGVAKI